MILFRNPIIANPGLDRGRQYQTTPGLSGQHLKRTASARKSVYGRYALRNHLRSMLRQKLGRQ